MVCSVQPCIKQAFSPKEPEHPNQVNVPAIIMPTKNLPQPSSESEDGSPDEKLDAYGYQDLKSANAIRLLRLRPGGKKATEVECELFEENLDRNPSYEALSWSWGGESWDHSIRIHHLGTVYSFDVPETLVAALKALRLRKKNRQLWIDAICINQVNSDEKNRQGMNNPPAVRDHLLINQCQ